MSIQLEPDESLWLGSVVITEEQRLKIKEFEDEHCKCHGKITIDVSSSGIGPNMYIRCSGCLKRVDISPYDRW